MQNISNVCLPQPFFFLYEKHTKPGKSCPHPYTCLNSMLESTAYGRGDEAAVIVFMEQNVLSIEYRYTFRLIVIIAGNRRGERPWLGWRH